MNRLWRSCLPSRWSRVGTLVAVFAIVSAVAGPTESTAASRVAKPVLETGQGDKCVEDTDFMRRNHMTLLEHQRDETVHKGIRTKQYSLNNCIECHASKKTNSVIGSNENFCQSCHAYVGVKLDCFECHASKPKVTAFHPLLPEHGAKTESARFALLLRQKLSTRPLAAVSGAEP